jgi:hypothetical protein
VDGNRKQRGSRTLTANNVKRYLQQCNKEGFMRTRHLSRFWLASVMCLVLSLSMGSSVLPASGVAAKGQGPS